MLHQGIGGRGVYHNLSGDTQALHRVLRDFGRTSRIVVTERGKGQSQTYNSTMLKQVVEIPFLAKKKNDR